MEKFITDERTGLQYELVGDYYLIAGEDEPEGRPIGIWGQRHLRYLKQHRKILYSELLISGNLNDYLADLNEQAEDMFSRLVKQLAEKEGVTESLKAENQMMWVQKMNNVRNTAMEVVSNDLIYALQTIGQAVVKQRRLFFFGKYSRSHKVLCTVEEGQ